MRQKAVARETSVTVGNDAMSRPRAAPIERKAALADAIRKAG
jgi:hypothetical protein